MVQINPAPIVLKDVTVTIGADTFEKQVSAVTLTPTAASSTWQGMAPGASYSDVALATWTAAITLAQDHETAGSLSDYLFANEGTKVTMIFKPRSTSGPSYQVTVSLTPGAIGGAVNAWAEATVTLPCDGKPTKLGAGTGVPVMGLATPATGGIAGGNLVQVAGSGFTGTTAVHFGTTLVPAADWTLVSPSLIIARAPAQAAGSKPVKVTNASGQSTTSAPYTYA
jgi:hypothetical protein